MSTVVTQEDSLSQFPSHVESIIRLALRLDWTGRWTTPQKKMIKLRSPGGEVDFVVPSTNVNYKRARSWVNKIARYSDTALMLREATLTGGGKAFPDTELARAMAEATAKLNPEPEPEVEDAPVPDGYGGWVEQPAVNDTLEVVEDAEPHVVSSVPWLVRSGTRRGDGSGKKYESPHTLEELMSDGSVRYKCKQCEFTHEAGKNVSWHAGQKHGAKTERETVTVPDYGDVEPRNLKPRLIGEILTALDSIHDWRDLSQEALSEALASVIIEARPHRQPATPLTPEQVLERIRYLVDGERIGAMHDEVAQLREQYTEVLARAEAAETAAAAANAETEKVRGNLRALDSMMREVIGDEVAAS